MIIVSHQIDRLNLHGIPYLVGFFLAVLNYWPYKSKEPSGVEIRGLGRSLESWIALHDHLKYPLKPLIPIILLEVVNSPQEVKFIGLNCILNYPFIALIKLPFQHSTSFIISFHNSHQKWVINELMPPKKLHVLPNNVYQLESLRGGHSHGLINSQEVIILHDLLTLYSLLKCFGGLANCATMFGPLEVIGSEVGVYIVGVDIFEDVEFDRLACFLKIEVKKSKNFSDFRISIFY